MENIDLENWMTNLPEKLRTIPINQLAIPGSHDSTTYGLKKDSNMSPDVRPPIRYLKFLQFLLSPFLFKWSQTQTATITQQLLNGIRYIDFRIAVRNKQRDFYFVHNLYSEKVCHVVNAINAFLETHPREVVIIDCQHLYNFKQLDHERLMNVFTLTFNVKLLRYMPDMDSITLDFMYNNNTSVIVIYRCDFSLCHFLFWPSISVPTPWPNTVSLRTLFEFLNNSLNNRDTGKFLVSQCVLTPTIWFAIRYLTSNLKIKCVQPLDLTKYQWILPQRPGIGGLNIVICDFVEANNFHFCKSVISLNKKLL